MTNPLFYAKILLFGEYGIIEDSQGLTLPYSFYKGCLQFSSQEISEFERESNLSLKRYGAYLMHLTLPEEFSLDMLSFQEDIEKGMFFNSDIPQGYGVGSSGALVAAVFERYCFVKRDPQSISKDELKKLKKIFGLMESFFHGKSSGIDPLICFMNLPILIENTEEVGMVDIPHSNGKGAIFLIDSGSIGETEPMVEIFFEKLKNEGFRKTLKEEFIRYNNACIDSFLKKEMSPFFRNLRKLSHWAYEHFRPMIPQSVFNKWKEGLDTGAYYLKLCGSGGGGYILGFAKDYEKAEQMLDGFSKEVIYRF